jgi:hypothetical protein
MKCWGSVTQDEGVAWSLDFLEPEESLEVLRTLGLAGDACVLTRSLWCAKSGTSWDKRHVYPAFETTPYLSFLKNHINPIIDL